MLPIPQPLLQAWRLFGQELRPRDAASQEAQPMRFGFNLVGSLSRSEHAGKVGGYSNKLPGFTLGMRPRCLKARSVA